MTAAIITDWRDISALSAFGLLYGIACAFLGYHIGQRKPTIATPEQRAISASAGAAMRTERMHMSMTAREIAQEHR